MFNYTTLTDQMSRHRGVSFHFQPLFKSTFNDVQKLERELRAKHSFKNPPKASGQQADLMSELH